MLPRRLPFVAPTRLTRLSCLRNRTTYRPISSTQPRRSGGASGDHHEDKWEGDEPGGWLWGIRPGEKYEKEGWENIMFYGYYGSLAVAVVAYCYKPDTTLSTWATEEAQRRLEKEGLVEDPDDYNPIVGPYPNKERYRELVLGEKPR